MIIDILQIVMTGFPGLVLIVAAGIVLFVLLTNMVLLAITFWKMRLWLISSSTMARQTFAFGAGYRVEDFNRTDPWLDPDTKNVRPRCKK